MSFFTQTAPKLRQEGFAPDGNPPASPPFDNQNMFFGHHIFPAGAQEPRPDFGDELAAMLARPASPHRPPHNPFDTNSTAPYRHPPHNIFDVNSNPAHFSLPDYTHNTHPYPERRSRSRSKPPAPSSNPPTARRKRASVSSTSPRPHAILIPPPGSPLALHMHGHAHPGVAHTAPSAWFAPADSPFSLPTPDSHFGVSPSTKDSPPPMSAGAGVGSFDGSYRAGGVGSFGAGPTGTDSASKQAALASEKRRRRRESHNAVERRRRDNINEKISELATLIPECMLDGGAGAGDVDPAIPTLSLPADTEDSKSPSNAERDTAVKANKGMILRKSVEYIRYLQQLVSAQAVRNRELEERLNGGGSTSFNPSRGDQLTMEADGMVVLGESPSALGLGESPLGGGSEGDGDAEGESPRESVRVKQEEEGAEGSEGRMEE